MSEQLPEAGNYELQQTFLRQEQHRISDRLFMDGALGKIIQANQIENSTDQINLALLDKVFVPALGNAEDDETELMLAAADEATTGEQEHLSYIPLGRINSVGVLFPYAHIPSEAATAVYQAAQELIQARAERLLPNLSPNLLDVFNPHTALIAMPPSNEN